ncbi:MAG: patatin-like phospholipase RssA [Bauldia sp.]|nr:patatin-like phospholipase RssA [Bauldia sp.]
MSRPRVGLALGSGAARGWAHVGVIEALRKAGIEPGIVCGCSMGSLVGAAYVTGRLEDLKEYASALTWREIAGLLDVRLTGGGLIKGERIVALMRRLKIVSAIETCPKPFAAIATDLTTGREIWLQDGRIDLAVRASISLPGIFAPVRHKERWLIDGGLVNPVPVSVCRALGAEVVIAVNLNSDLLGPFRSESDELGAETQSGISRSFLDRVAKQIPFAIREQASAIAPMLFKSTPDHPGYFEALTLSISIMQDRITRSRLAGEPAHVTLVPHLPDFASLDFHRAGEAFAAGAACVEEALPSLRRYVAGRV